MNLSSTQKTNKQVFQSMQAQGIMVNFHYIPVYLQPFYEEMGFKKGCCPEAERYFMDAISIPMYPTLSKENQVLVVEALENSLNDRWCYP